MPRYVDAPYGPVKLYAWFLYREYREELPNARGVIQHIIRELQWRFPWFGEEQPMTKADWNNMVGTTQDKWQNLEGTFLYKRWVRVLQFLLEKGTATLEEVTAWCKDYEGQPGTIVTSTYVVQLNSSVKVGMSVNVESRLRSYGLGNKLLAQYNWPSRDLAAHHERSSLVAIFELGGKPVTGNEYFPLANIALVQRGFKEAAEKILYGRS